MTTAVAAIMDAVFPTTTCSETMAAVLSGFCFSSPAAADVDAETTTMAAIPTQIIGIPESQRAFGIFALGYPAEERTQQDRYDETRIHRVTRG